MPTCTKDHFIFEDQVFEGNHGHVVLATMIETGEKYAIKILSKHEVIRLRREYHVQMEKAALKLMNHENVIKFFCDFQDSENLCEFTIILLSYWIDFAFEYVPGGPMSMYLQRYGRLSFNAAQFYIAELVNGLAHIHGNGIVHRNLRPNVGLLFINFNH
jgi:serine/threonine protein kinase